MTRWVRQYLSADEYHAHRVNSRAAAGRSAVQSWEVVELAAYGKALLLDGCIQSTQHDEATYHEALHCPAIIARPDTRRALLIGGANGGSLPRLLALPALEHVLVVDIDEELHAESRSQLSHMHGNSLSDPRVEWIFGSPDIIVASLAREKRQFDLIIADTPDATELSYSTRLFALERIHAIAELLAPAGLFATQAGQAHPFACRLAARVKTTLARVFPEVVLYSHLVPSFGIPWCFALAGSKAAAIATLDPSIIDSRIEELRFCHLSSYDGTTHRHMFALPRFLRESLEKEELLVGPITLSDPEIVAVSR